MTFTQSLDTDSAQVSSLTGFLIVTGIFELPVLMVLMFLQSQLAFEWSLNLALAIMLAGIQPSAPAVSWWSRVLTRRVVEVFISYNATVKISREQAARYHLLYSDFDVSKP